MLTKVYCNCCSKKRRTGYKTAYRPQNGIQAVKRNIACKTVYRLQSGADCPNPDYLTRLNYNKDETAHFRKKTFFPYLPASERYTDELSQHAYDKQDVEENPLYTGRHLLILKEGNKSVLQTIKLLEDKWGFSVANTADFVTETLNEGKIKDADALFYNDLGIALLSIDDDMVAQLNTYTGYILEPEKVVYIPDEIPVDTTEKETATWGIKAVQADESVYTGAGIK